MNLYILATILISATVSLLAVHWIYFKVLKIAKEKNLVDNPDARKLQKTPVPVVGGLAVFFGLTFGLLAGRMILGILSSYIVPGIDIPYSTNAMPLILGLGIMLYIGCLDDIMGLSHRSRFVIEILVILGLIYSSGMNINSLHGLWGIHDIPQYLAIPLTVFAGVGIINAVNMVDGVNGLSSGLCITCCIIFGSKFILSNELVNSLLAYTMAASLILFFVHNVFGNQSKMFIGDAGTMIMGTLMTWFVICSMYVGNDSPELRQDVCPTAMLIAFLSVPIADTLRVMTMRILKGKSPFRPDKTHLHHAFVELGTSHSITALAEIIINLSIVGIWYVSVILHAPYHCQLYTVVLAAAILVWGTYFFLRHERHSNSRQARWLRYLSIKTHFGNTQWWQRISFYLDAPEFNERERRNLRERLRRKFDNVSDKALEEWSEHDGTKKQ